MDKRTRRSWNMMSTRYQRAMIIAAMTLEELGPKIAARIPLSPGECNRLLNTNWQVYLLALSEGDVSEAKEAAAFDKDAQAYVKMHGYKVTFNGIYCVTA